MRILLCCPTPVTLTLGASKVYLEAAEGFRRAGWNATVIGPEEVAGGPPGDMFTQPPRLREYLRRHALEFDVVEYEHHQLPFPRSDFPGGPLFVARSVLLAYIVASTRIPTRPVLWSRAGRLLKGWWERRLQRQLVRQANLTLAAADLINVCNTIERDTLVVHGHPADKICMFPYGLFPERLAAFRADPHALPDPPVVGFIGTFDPRKGMCEFSALVNRVVRRIPGATFRLLGTAGMVPDADGVRGYFSRRLWPSLEIHPRYDPNELPGLLAGVSVGVFPSRMESFGYGVLELLAASVPVIAYDAPGPHVILPPQYRVPVGSAGDLADRVCDLLTDPDRLREARLWARDRVALFNWERVAMDTARVYLDKQAGRRGRPPAPL
jgi:glycosyltransferase involved in cell wall biosynthesis